MSHLVVDRQTIVVVAAKGAYTSKPRPWVVLQNEDYKATNGLILCGFTHILVRDAGLLRIDITPSEQNGLRLPCQLQVDKVITVKRTDIGKHIGRLEDGFMQRLEVALRAIMCL